MTGIADTALTIADLDGGTLFDWWNTHIGKVIAYTYNFNIV